jgi:A/G-specific adenine glycosylase
MIEKVIVVKTCLIKVSFYNEIVMFKNIHKRNKNQYFRDKVKAFYHAHKRDFFWRRVRLKPFQIMIVELFLKKTKAETVNTRMYGFVSKYNTPKKILKERKAVILRKISPLGLGSQRTIALRTISKHIQENYEGTLPSNLTKIENIPHIGLYISNATLCFGFNKRVPILDVNTNRVISRVFGIDGKQDLRDNKKLQETALKLLPRKSFKEYNWGLLDLGALICKPIPLCVKCPLKSICWYYRNVYE